ncbi:hypothetical protein GIB67_039605, partial [Kingdonia uniflora]
MNLFTNLILFIYIHVVPELPRIPKELDSDNYEHCTCYKWGGSVTDRNDGLALLKFRESFDNYKVEDPNEYATLSPNGCDTMPIRGECGRLDQQIAFLNGELQKLKEDKDKKYEANIKLAEALKEKISEYNLLRETIDQMKEDMQLKRVLDEQCALAYADLPGQLDAKILECKNLQEKSITLEAKLRQKSGLEDCNDNLSVELNKKSKESESLKVSNVLLMEQLDLQLPPAIPWVKYLLDVRGVNMDDNNSAFRVPATIQHQSQHRFQDVIKTLKSFLTKDPTFWKSIFIQTLGIPFSPAGEKAYESLLQAFSFGHQHGEYRHMRHLLSTCYEKVVVFISHTEVYIFLPLFWAQKKNTTSNEERFQKVLIDT